MDKGRVCLAAADFVISCGTITFNINLEPKIVLVIRWHRTGEFLLPKGRKNVGETLQQAAERETFEETGYTAKIFPTRFETQATGQSAVAEGLTEPLAMTQRTTDGVLKIIFWFVAVADRSVAPVSGTQQDDEDFETFWLPIKEAMRVLSWPDDREVLSVATKVIARTELGRE